MMKKYVIASLFVSVLLVHLGHNIVPHHHHMDPVTSHRDCREHDDENDAMHHGDPTDHCHAFNGMEYFPAPENHGVNKPVKQGKIVFFPQQTPEKDLFSASRKFDREPAGLLLRPEFLLGSAAGLRAPPVFG